MKIIKNKILPPKGYSAIMLFGLLFTKEDKLSDKTINHEMIHERQMLEMLVVFFYLWYVIEWLVRFVQYLDFQMAYRNISFEKEAYSYEREFDYLSKRKFWSFIKFI